MVDEDESGRPPDDAKRALRRTARDARARTAAAAGWADLEEQWAEHVLRLADAHGARVVAAYAAYGAEPPTRRLVETLLTDDATPRPGHAGLPARTVLLPVLLDDHDLDWVDAATMSTSQAAGQLRSADVTGDLLLGVDAVADADLVVVPALLADRSGARLGQGGGSYDRALTRVRADALVVALVHDDELLPGGSLPMEPHDRHVNHVVTPSGVTECGQPDARA